MTVRPLMKTPCDFIVGQAVIALMLLSYVAACLVFALRGEPLNMLGNGVALVSAFALAGLYRRVRWGQFLTSLSVLFVMLFGVVNLIPGIDRRTPHFLEVWVGPLPLYVHWLILVGFSIAALVPLVLVGRHKSLWRESLW